MITFIEGELVFKGDKFCAVSVAGVGYKVSATGETLKKIPEKGGKVKLWTHLYMREDALELYGFLNFAELEFFETLIHVPGIGPKGGLGVLSLAPLDTLKKAIASGDTTYLTKVSGIGRKTAEKIILELRDKMAAGKPPGDTSELKEETDALDALVALGYSQREAREALSRVSSDITSAEKKLAEALKKLGGNK